MKDKGKFVGILSDKISRATSPVILVGGGFWSAHHDYLVEELNRLPIPVVTTWTGARFASRIENYVGVVGQFGRPLANNVFHTSDLVLALGSRLPTTVTGVNVDSLQEKIFHVDVDSLELNRQEERLSSLPSLTTIHSALETVGVAIESAKLRERLAGNLAKAKREYVNEQKGLEHLFHTASHVKGFNSHLAVASFLASSEPDSEALVIDGGGTALYSAFQAAPLEKFSAVMSASAISSMGTAPAQMFAVAQMMPKIHVVGIIGDGSFFTALNQLPSLAQLPNTLLVVISNGGYLAIRHTQEKFLESRFHGTYSSSGHLPPIEPLVKAMGFSFVKASNEILLGGVRRFLRRNVDPRKPTILEIFANPNQPPFWSVNSVADSGTTSPRPESLASMICKY